MCVLDSMKHAVKHDDMKELRTAVETFRLNGFSYLKIANLAYSHCDIELSEFDDLMSRLDHESSF